MSDKEFVKLLKNPSTKERDVIEYLNNHKSYTKIHLCKILFSS
jgi:hypothetical protein